MRAMRVHTRAILMLGALLSAAPVLAQTELRERIGYARSPVNGELIYTEHHAERYEAGRLVRDTVTYRDAKGTVFAVKEVDFTVRPTLPEFSLENHRTGHAEGARKRGNGFEVRFRRHAADSLERARVAAPAEAIIDAGFDRFIERHWSALARGEVMIQPFLIPSRLAFYDFRIARVAASESDDANTVMFRLEIDSALLRLVVAPVEVAYAADTRALLSYHGLSNIRDDRGKNYQVRIDFGDPASARAVEPAPIDRAHDGSAPASLPDPPPSAPIASVRRAPEPAGR